jgi:UDP-N-acetylglucosamine 2-epimerase (non-hydrolysing)
MISIILGTRPEIIKMAPIIRECEKEGISYEVIHTGQHYDYMMDRVFFKELNLNPATKNLKVGSGTQSEVISKIMLRLGKVLLKNKPEVVLTEGDTNSVLAASLAVRKSGMKIRLGHVEAGLRSHYYEMPEEYNRIVSDHISDYLFAPTKESASNLKKENIPKERIFLTGNTIVDAVYHNARLAGEKSRILQEIKVSGGDYFLLTAHRQENVDNRQRLTGLLEGLRRISENHSLPIVYPMHPRTKKRITEFGLQQEFSRIKNLKLTNPLGYLDFLALERNASVIITDSGGVQEEACILRTPCVTIRDNTERPETIKVKSNILAGCDPEKIEIAAKEMIKKKRKWKNPFGDGNSAKRIIRIIQDGI